MTNYLEFKNFSTILNSIIVIICGYLVGLLVSYGINLPFTASELAAFITAIIFGIFSYYNAKNHNDIFDKETDTLHIPVDNLTENQVDAINNFIANATEKNVKFDKEIESDLEDLDLDDFGQDDVNG